MKILIIILTIFGTTAQAGVTRQTEADQLISVDKTKVYSLPAATDTLVGRASTDTLTNKSISGATNTFTSIPASSALSGQVPIANGGSGQSTANSALNAFLPSQSGNSGKFLKSDGTDTSWQFIRFQQDKFTSCNGATVNFTLTQTPSTTAAIFAYLNGLNLIYGGSDDFTVSGTTLTLTTACATGQVLHVRYIY